MSYEEEDTCISGRRAGCFVYNIICTLINTCMSRRSGGDASLSRCRRKSARLKRCCCSRLPGANCYSTNTSVCVCVCV
jgi:hypothetical protein